MVALIRYFHTYAFKSVFILWVYTPVEYGGLQQKVGISLLPTQTQADHET